MWDFMDYIGSIIFGSFLLVIEHMCPIIALQKMIPCTDDVIHGKPPTKHNHKILAFSSFPFHFATRLKTRFLSQRFSGSLHIENSSTLGSWEERQQLYR